MIKQILSGYSIYSYQIDTYLSGEELLLNNDVIQYDVIFLDINMPKQNGIEIARKIREKNTNVLLVFVTAFMDFALEGYKMEAIRFLLKDMLEEMLPECIETIIKKLDLQTKKIRYDFIQGNKEIPVEKICFVESQGHKIVFNIFDSKPIQYSLYNKLDNVEKELQIYGFLRIHKSFLVNTYYIQSIVNYKVKMKNGVILPVPRERYRYVKEKYYEIKGEMI